MTFLLIIISICIALIIAELVIIDKHVKTQITHKSDIFEFTVIFLALGFIILQCVRKLIEIYPL